MTKTHKLANKKKFQVEYGFKGGKWNFRIGNFTLMTKVPGGKVNADHIAEILRKSWFRCNEIDGTARNAITRIVNADFKALKDYRGKWDHNWSWADGGVATTDTKSSDVKMIPPPKAVAVETETPAEAANVTPEAFQAAVVVAEQKAIETILA